MGNTVYLFLMFGEFRFIGSLIAAGLMLALPSIERRSKFLLRSTLCAVICLAFTFFYLLVIRWRIEAGGSIFVMIKQWSWYALLVALYIMYMRFCFKFNMSELLWLGVLSYSMQHIGYVIINEILFMLILPQYSYNLAWYAPISIVAYSIIYFVFYRIFIPNIRGRNQLPLENSIKMRVVWLLLLLAFHIITLFNQHLVERSRWGDINYMSMIVDLFNCILIVIVQYGSLRTARLYMEKSDTMRLYNDSIKQHTNFKESVDYINVKFHDMKHELRRMEQEGQLNSEGIEKLKERIALYESSAKTGNETLDMVLTDRFVYCYNNKIAFSYMAEAEMLNRIKDSDAYTLFANILDNAIEYVKNIGDEQKRFIRLSVKPQGNMLYIHQENYFDGSLEFIDGLPQTTNADKIYHGFGVKSIQNVTKSYGGSLRIDVKDELYRLDIVFPCK